MKWINKVKGTNTLLQMLKYRFKIKRNMWPRVELVLLSLMSHRIELSSTIRFLMVEMTLSKILVYFGLNSYIKFDARS